MWHLNLEVKEFISLKLAKFIRKLWEISFFLSISNNNNNNNNKTYKDRIFKVPTRSEFRVNPYDTDIWQGSEKKPWRKKRLLAWNKWRKVSKFFGKPSKGLWRTSGTNGPNNASNHEIVQRERSNWWRWLVNTVVRTQGVIKGPMYHLASVAMPGVGIPHYLIPSMANAIPETCYPPSLTPMPSEGLYTYPYMPLKVVPSPLVTQAKINLGMLFT